MLQDILLIIAGLGGLGALMSMLVSVLKLVGVIKDGYAERWYQGMSLVVFIAVTVLYFIQVPIDWGQVDGILMILSTALGFVIQILGGKLTYKVIEGMPIIGFSRSKNTERELSDEGSLPLKAQG